LMPGRGLEYRRATVSAASAWAMVTMASRPRGSGGAPVKCFEVYQQNGQRRRQPYRGKQHQSDVAQISQQAESPARAAPRLARRGRMRIFEKMRHQQALSQRESCPGFEVFLKTHNIAAPCHKRDHDPVRWLAAPTARAPKNPCSTPRMMLLRRSHQNTVSPIMPFHLRNSKLAEDCRRDVEELRLSGADLAIC